MGTSTWLSVLCEPGALGQEVVTAAVAALSVVGFEPVRMDGRAGEPIVGATADGTGDLLFADVREAVALLGSSEGLLAFQSDRFEVEVTLSVHRAEGILPRELSAVPDEPVFDVLNLAAEDLLGQPAVEVGQWPVYDAWIAVLNAIPFVYAHCLDDDAFERVAGRYCPHGSVASGTLPPFVPWLSAIPEGSTLSAALQELADVCERPVSRHGAIDVVRLAGLPGTSSHAARKATRRWEKRGAAGRCR